MTVGGARADRPLPSDAEVARLLRRTRNGDHAVRTRPQVLYVGYLVGLVLLWAGVPAVGAVRALLDPGSALLGDPVGAAAAAPLLLVATAAGAMLLGLRLATWQGPLLVSAATVAWYLTLPIDRAAALHPPLLRGLLAMTAAGLLAGAVLGLLLASATASSAARTVAAASGGGALLGLLTASVGLFVERGTRATRAVIVGSPFATAVVCATFVGVTVLRGADVGRVSAVLLWSGPWGWAAQPALAAATGTAPLWPVALGLLVLLTTAAAIGAWRAADEVPDGVLRVRARARTSFGAALYLGEPRDARLAARPARAHRARQVRLRPPSDPRLVVVWRDALHLRRAPVRVVAAAGYLVAAALLLGAGAPPGWTATGSALLVHGAAGQLLETARLDADDPRRTRLFACDSGRVASQHAALATAVLILLGWTVAAAATGAGGLALGQLPLVMTLIGVLAPVPVVAGLLSAYKGRPPLLLAVRGDDQGPMALMGWYLIGPLASLSLLSPVALLPASAGMHVLALEALFTGIGTSTLGLAAVARRARRLDDP